MPRKPREPEDDFVPAEPEVVPDVEQVLAELGGHAATVQLQRQAEKTRSLDLLTNPTAQPITIDVRLTSHTRFIRKGQGGFTVDREPRLIATSSGDARLDVADPATRDRWVVIDDEDDGDPFLVDTLPAVAYVFDGPGAAQQAGAAGFSRTNMASATVVAGQVTVAATTGSITALDTFNRPRA